MNGEITVRKISPGDAQLKNCFDIRRRVFVDEQHCPADLEYRNDDVSTHFLAYWDNIPCGAARWRKTDKGIKLERFAVLPRHRGKGVGAELLKAVLKDISPTESVIYLNSQLSAMKFYLPFGFRPVGEQFEEAGIIHQQMLFYPRS